VWWVSAATSSDLHAGLREVAARAGAAEADLSQAWSGQSSAVELLWRLLASYRRRWLLVIDNADDPRILAPVNGLVSDGRGWLRPVGSRRGAIVVTSREGGQVWGGWCHRQPVGMLNPHDGASVLLDYAGPQAGTVDQAAALSERLGGLPLALRLAGNYLRAAARHPIVDAVVTFEQYRARLDAAGGDQLLGAGVRIPVSDAAARLVVGATWELSLRMLDERDVRHARHVLRLLATFADAAIPSRLLLDTDLMAASPPLRGLTAPELVSTLDAVADQGLLDRSVLPDPQADSDGGIEVVRLHPLVRDTSRAPAGSGDELEYLDLTARLLHHAADGPTAGRSDDPDHWPHWRLLTPHAFGVREAVSALAAPPPSTVGHVCDAARRCVRFLQSAGHRRQAETELTAVLTLQRRTFGDEHPATLATRHRLGQLLVGRGEYEAAKAELQVVVDTRGRLDGHVRHPDTLIARHWLAITHQDQGQHSVAEAEFRAIIQDRTRSGEPDDLAWALAARRRLAGILNDRDDYAGAESELRAVLDAHPTDRAEDRRMLRLTRAELGRVLYYRGNLSAAENMLRSVLDEEVRAYGRRDHPDTIFTRVWLAVTALARGDYDVATAEFHAIDDANRGAANRGEHPPRWSCRYWLARVEYARGNYDAAHDGLQAVLDDEIRANGNDHGPSTLAVRHWLAVVQIARGNYNAAEVELHAVAAAWRPGQSDHQRWTRGTRYWLARIHHARGALDRAETELRDVLDDDIQAHGRDDHPEVLHTRHWLAVVQCDRGDYTTAEPEFRHVLASRVQQLGEQHPDTVRTRQALAHLLDQRATT
jgi:tetratricopeptide (TPR) repeat protein